MDEISLGFAIFHLLRKKLVMCFAACISEFVYLWIRAITISNFHDDKNIFSIFLKMLIKKKYMMQLLTFIFYFVFMNAEIEL